MKTKNKLMNPLKVFEYNFYRIVTYYRNYCVYGKIISSFLVLSFIQNSNLLILRSLFFMPLNGSDKFSLFIRTYSSLLNKIKLD